MTSRTREPSRSLGSPTLASLALTVALAASTGCSDASGYEDRFIGTYVGSYSGLPGQTTTASIYDVGENFLLFSVTTDPLGRNPCPQVHVKVTGPTSATLGPDSHCNTTWVAESATFTLDGDELSVTWTSVFRDESGGATDRTTLTFEGRRTGGETDADAGS
jgi:hypothetical protein